MSNFRNGFVLALLALSLASCKIVSIENGRVPQEYLTSVRDYTGEYVGMFNGQPGKVVLELNNDSVKVSFIDGAGNDFLGANCESKVGDLTRLYVRGDSPNTVLTQASFKFDANKCSREVHGKTLEIYFNSDRGLELSIVETYYSEETMYLQGEFKKIN